MYPDPEEEDEEEPAVDVLGVEEEEEDMVAELMVFGVGEVGRCSIGLVGA